MTRPNSTLGMHHLALNIFHLEECVAFYCDLVGMQIEWKPDPDNYYLTSGRDNLALHRASNKAQGDQHLDHLGFILKTPEDVDAWCEFLTKHQVEIRKQPKTHRDGARSFYCADPDGNLVQFIYHPPLSGAQK